ncbi:TIGR03619 family F420-dependent LLM class oxidoreductase [Natronorubrum sp. FCH18a]|uniref:TIGR03619 family F420-dependent LLM class oxidoreductase n=1 Tax=Natronorubrum sp. FCH18a TaxID=3447018 RepID=UPI003F50ED09
MGEHASPETFRRVATTAEDTGFDSLTVGEHITFPEEMSESPFSPSGEPPAHFDIGENTYTTFEVLSFLAAVTDDIGLKTSMCIAPLHNPVELTNEIFTVNALSNGRVDVGVAPGWLETEFDVLNVPFEERGARLDDFLEIFTTACNTPEFAYDGQTYSFDKTGFRPAPERKDGPSVWIGGTSGASLRRTAEFADGFVVVWESPDEISSLRSRALNAWDDYNRDGEPAVGVSRPFYVATRGETTPDRPLMGEPAKIIEDIQAFRDVGVTQFDLAFTSGDPDDQITQLERFSDSVLSQLS